MFEFLFNDILSNVYLADSDWNYLNDEDTGNSHEYFTLCCGLIERRGKQVNGGVFDSVPDLVRSIIK